ncbi:Crp/Fnr family transcriptional regulator [Variovorax sp. Sphag1AA]|uniref:Crp/Fnr family transcriptional regulator n=1 Tax=Variovorax sp. Sphag1AA TaxID=2587027 RepID=UPI0016170E33|nr:Crp/Fnr family transcriptional regulator [Variovorax sp. Sphag1AA]MBB3178643.1 CRP-like cAMP-binding protein [Variovorax sp. Sphag1AA]
MTRPQRAPATSLTLDELLEQSAWFVQLDEPTQAQVRRDATERAVALGDSLGHHGEQQHAWYGVLEGLVKWAITAQDGRTVSLGGQSVGSWFGEGTLIRNEPRQSDLVALRPSRVALIPFDTFDWLRRNRPTFNDFLLMQVNERLHWFMGNYAAQGLLDTDSQVARALIGMVNPLANPLGERHLQLSQEEIANLAAVSRQSCNSALMRFKSAGLVRSEYGGIVVLDIPGLQRLVP